MATTPKEAPPVAAALAWAAGNAAMPPEPDLFAAYRAVREGAQRGPTWRLRLRLLETALFLRYRWVIHYAIRNRTLAGPDRDELEAEAWLAMLTAFRRFNPSLGWRFSTFARVTIRHAVVGYRRAAIRRQTRCTLVDPCGLVIDASRSVNLRGSASALPRDPAVSAAIATGLRRLPPRLRDIVERRYGLSGRPAQTRRDVGRALGLSRERIRQLEAQALTALRRALPAALQLECD
jgi:RNA polymerase sigma factor (sigma-70 family)